PSTPEGAHTTPTQRPETTKPPVRLPSRSGRLRLTPGMGPAGRAGMTQGQRGVAPLTAGLQRRFSKATPDSKAAQQQPNARGEPRPEAGAQRTLEGVGSTAGLGRCPQLLLLKGHAPPQSRCLIHLRRNTEDRFCPPP